MRAKDGTRKIQFKLTQGDAAGEGRLCGRGGKGRVVGLNGSKCMVLCKRVEDYPFAQADKADEGAEGK